MSAYVGDGSNRWAAAHVSDTARLYRLALEKGDAGSKWHAVGEQGVTAKEIAGGSGRPPQPTRRLDISGGGSGSLRLDKPFRDARLANLECEDPRAAGLGADRTWAHRRFESSRVVITKGIIMHDNASP